MNPEDKDSADDSGEVSMLIRALRVTDQRLQELTDDEVDSVVDRDGHAFLLRRAQEKLRHSEAAKQAGILNALPANVALLDTRGAIVSVNRGWRKFADANGLVAVGHGVGCNYLDVCDSARGDRTAEARAVAAGIRSVLAARSSYFNLEYPCHSPETKRWYLVAVTPLVHDRLSGVVVMHIDVTERRRGLETIRRFASTMDTIEDGIHLIDRSSMSFIHINAAGCRMLGLTREEVLERSPMQILRSSRANLEQTYDTIIASAVAPPPIEWPVDNADGSRSWIEIRRHAQHSEYGWTIVTQIRDITARKAAEQRIKYLNRVYAMLSGINMLIVKVRERDELFTTACRIAVDEGGFRKAWVGMIDPDTGCVMPVASACMDEELLGSLRAQLSSSQGSLKGNTLTARAIRENMPQIYNETETDAGIAFARQWAEAGINSAIVLPLTVEGEAAGVLALYAPEKDFFHAEELALLKELAGDISFAITNIGTKERAEYLALYDELTGLANRTLFLDRLTQHIHGAVSDQRTMALLLIDLERFKDINDTLGWTAGDALLGQVAEWLTILTGDASLLARVGVNHFAVLLPDTKEGRAVSRIVERALESFSGHPFRLNEAPFRITGKAGIARFPADGRDAETLIRNAEAALKKAKAGGDPYLFYTRHMSAAVAGRLTLETQLRDAVDNDEFVLHYQPKVNLVSGMITGAEALIRWNNPLATVVMPGEFIPILEETGLIFSVGRWVLRQVIDDYRKWSGAGLSTVPVAVNVSALQLRNRNFLDMIREVVGDDERAAAALELEITESLIMENVRNSITKLKEIRALGIRVAIDDFGTGFSSLSYLSKLPVDTLKIDRSFVTDMTAGPDGLALVSTIITLAHSLSLTVVAEGVETEEQQRLLRLLNCDAAQGYLFCKPVPGEIFAAKYLPGPPAGWCAITKVPGRAGHDCP